jgi:hypothetical protein
MRSARVLVSQLGSGIVAIAFLYYLQVAGESDKRVELDSWTRFRGRQPLSRILALNMKWLVPFLAALFVTHLLHASFGALVATLFMWLMVLPCGVLWTHALRIDIASRFGDSMADVVQESKNCQQMDADGQ